MTTDHEISKRFSMKISSKTHPKHHQYLGMKTLEHGLGQMKFFAANQHLDGDQVGDLFEEKWFDLEALTKVLEEVKVGDILGVGWNPWLVEAVGDPAAQTGWASKAILAKNISEHFMEGSDLEQVKAETKSQWLDAGTLCTAVLMGNYDILYREGKPYGQPEQEVSAVIVEVEDENGNKIPVLRVKKGATETPDTKEPGDNP